MQRRRTGIYFLWPSGSMTTFDPRMVLASVLAVLMFSGSLFGLAAFVDHKENKREVTQVGHAIADRMELLATNFPGQLDWDEAILKLDNQYDADWANKNIGVYFCSTLHFDVVYLLGSDNLPKFGMQGVDVVGWREFQPLRLASARLVESVRRQELSRGPFREPYKMYGGDISRPIQASGLVQLGRTSMVLTATLVQPNAGTALPLGPRAPIVLAGKVIDPAFLQPISEGLEVQQLHLMPADEKADAKFILRDMSGSAVAALGWTPERPGRQLVLIAFFPILFAVCLPLWLYLYGRRMGEKLGVAVQELEELATHDPLTKLLNRRALHNRLQETLTRAASAQGLVGIMFLDLDRFKTVNDSLGHLAGDELLCVVSQRLKAQLRPADTLARVGGDEFVVVIGEASDNRSVESAARVLIAAVLEPLVLADGNEIFIGTSVGISMYPSDGVASEQLIQKADAALYLAKGEGRGTYRFFTQELTALASNRLDLEARLRRAVERSEFALCYQPLVSLSDRRIVHIEALVRWHDPERGTVLPVRFFQAAEDTGLIVKIGAWALQSACSQMKIWRDMGLTGARIAVNLSPAQFRRSDLVAQIKQVLQYTELPAEALELEVTEGALMHSIPDSIAKLDEMRALGVGIAIDDFGTGFSSLVSLRQFKIDTLKIDRAFVDGIGHNETDRQVIIALLTLAKSLDIECSAEGIETEEQLDFLLQHGCEFGQGYLFSRPCITSQMQALLLQQPALMQAG